MNKKQKAVLIVTALIILLMGFIPPWTETFKSDSARSKRPLGYFPVVSPPRPSSDARAFGVTLDLSRLLVQWFAVAFIGGGLYLVLKSKK